MKSSFGNYVVQKALKVSNEENRNKLVETILNNIEKLNERKLIDKWKKIVSNSKGICLSPCEDYNYNNNNSINLSPNNSFGSLNSNCSNRSFNIKNTNMNINNLNINNFNNNRLIVPNIAFSKSQTGSPTNLKNDHMKKYFN